MLLLEDVQKAIHVQFCSFGKLITGNIATARPALTPMQCHSFCQLHVKCVVICNLTGETTTILIFFLHTFIKKPTKNTAVLSRKKKMLIKAN